MSTPTRSPRPVMPPFRLEAYFSRWEFTARHHLTASDAQTMSIGELLALGTEAERAEFEQLPLGYLETWGTDRLRAAVASSYETLEPADVLAFAGADEALYWLLRVFKRSPAFAEMHDDH